MNNFSNNYFFDIEKFTHKEILAGTPWETVANILSYIKKIFVSHKLSPNYKNRPDVYVGEGTTIHPSVDIQGPAIIGANCQISHAAFLREGCIIGDNVHIGHAVEIKHSLILNNAMIAHLNYIGDSIIGNNVNISGGAILANFRLDKENITVKTGGGFKIDTGLNKFSAAIGDNSVIGVNAVINPGTLLGKNVIVFPLKSVSGVHENNATIK
jgi:NDP-sugar pyrophosphorylase family protein